jgi:hypothetical protein
MLCDCGGVCLPQYLRFTYFAEESPGPLDCITVLVSQPIKSPKPSQQHQDDQLQKVLMKVMEDSETVVQVSAGARSAWTKRGLCGRHTGAVMTPRWPETIITAI